MIELTFVLLYITLAVNPNTISVITVMIIQNEAF